MARKRQLTANTIANWAESKAQALAPAASVLQHADLILVRKLLKGGLTAAEINQRTGIPVAEVERMAGTFKDTRAAARELLDANAYTFADRIVREADVEQSLEMLDRFDVAPKKREDRNDQVQVLIGLDLGT